MTTEPLTKENARDGLMIQHIHFPEWGTKPLVLESDGWSIGRGCNSAVLFENEFRLWEIVRK